ncbi:MAG: histidine kinase [Gammaproteobacteria bacterium]|nr:histidine kinase [Gammaproteobacteria bacterium]
MPLSHTSLYSDFKNASWKRLINCISILFLLLSALAISSYWLVHSGEQQNVAIMVHVLLLVCVFAAVASIGLRNQRQQLEENLKKNQAQDILFKIASSINTCRELKELLNRFCDSIYLAIEADNVSIWLVTENNWLEYIASTGIDPAIVNQHKKLKLTDELSNVITENKIIHNNEHVTKLAETLLCDVSEDYKSYYIPLHYQDRTLGVIRIKITSLPFNNHQNFEELLVTLAKHLSIAIEKARVDQESRRMIIMQERSLIANELHDSLAQTLASLRFQVRVLDENLQSTSEFKSIRGIEQVENSLDEAYSDLRELIAHCRTPINNQGLIAAVEKLISRFRKESGMHVLLQKEWQYSDLPPNMEMHIFRIIQEAMNNIRKHSDANNVHIMFRCNEKGDHHILIENDGIGFETPTSSDHPGKHLGLTIMKERAAHLGGELRIESEPDEGTRIELNFKYNAEAIDDPLKRLSGITR